MRLTILFSILYLFLFSSSYCQNSDISVDKISDDNDNLRFPKIYSHDSLVTEKINTHLYLSELDIIYGKEVNNIFKNVVDDEQKGIYGGKVRIDFEVLDNSSRNLSVKFDQTSCGATCGYWVRYYNFNPKTGDRYSLRDFFNQSILNSLRN